MSKVTKISIVTICFNNKAELERTIQSVISQKYDDYEYIVIDGGSNDGTVDLLKQYDSHIDIWTSEPDRGIYNAMNKGANKASGEWIFFLNSGDIFASENVLNSINFDIGSTDLGGIFGRYKYYSRYDELLLNNCEHPFFESKSKFRGMGFSHQSVFVRTSLVKHFMFDETFKLCADYNLMMQIYKAGYKFKRVETIIAVCDGRGGASFNNRYLQERELARVCGCDDDIRLKINMILRQIVRPFYRIYKKHKVKSASKTKKI